MPVIRRRGSSILRILGAVFFLLVLAGWTLYHANFVLGRSMMLAFPGWEVTYRSAWPLPSGGAIANDVILIPPQESSVAGKFHFDSVRITVPFFEYYRSGFSRERSALLSAINNLHIEFNNGHGDLNYPFTDELAAFGSISAAPFEAEGCAEDMAWIEKELGDMGLKTHGTRLVLDYRLEPARLIKRQEIYTPGAGRVRVRREMIRHDRFSLFSLIETGLSEISADEWHVKDEGFVAARNRHCADKDKVTADEFLRRHEASVQRLLEAEGLAPSADLVAAYREYAAHGGNFDLVAHYDPPIGAELYSADDMRGWLPLMQGSFAINGKSMPLALSAITPRPLTESERTEPTFASISREREGAGRLGAIAADNPASTSLALRSESASAASVQSVYQAAPPSEQELRSATASLPNSAQKAAADPVDTHAINYRQLAEYVGRRVKVYQRGEKPMHVQILRVLGNGDVSVRRHFMGGDFDFILARNKFDHAEE